MANSTWKPYLKFRKLSLCFSVKEKVDVDPLSWRLREISEGVAVLEGYPRGVKSSHEVYSYRFDKAKFKYPEAKAYLEENNITELRKYAELKDDVHALLQKRNQEGSAHL